ncbi:tyrosine-type recombinase/integrase [Streptomyces sp. NPDC021722]|uniref:site-specific integrase n=1 Tax=Streptomyces sp. NPDC021722 TaxID=3154904 RepID=UPI0033EC1391
MDCTEDLTLATYLAEWLRLKEKTLKPTTFARYRDHMHADLIPSFGRLLLTDLRARHITAWSEAELARGRGRTAVYRIGATFSSALGHAVRTRVIAVNPCRYVLLPRPVAPERICRNPTQAAAFLRHNHAHYGDQMADLFELLLATGMRRGESLGLRWSDVHLAERMLLVGWSLTAVNNSHLYLGHLQTKASRNWVSLAPRVVAALERHAALARAGQPKGTPLEGLVFCRPDGSPLRPQGVLVELRRRTAELGLPRIRCGTIRLVSAALFEMHDEWIALPRQHLPEGDMGDICRKLSFGSSRYPTCRNATSS